MQCGPERGHGHSEGFTFAGVLTGLTATAAIAVLCSFLASRAVQHGVRQAGDAMAGMESALAEDLGGLVPTDPGFPVPGTDGDYPSIPRAAWREEAVPFEPVCWTWPRLRRELRPRAGPWIFREPPSRLWLHPVRGLRARH